MLWVDFGFYFNASAKFFTDKFIKENESMFSEIKEKFGFVVFEDYLEHVKTEYKNIVGKDFGYDSPSYIHRKKYIEEKVSRYCIQNKMGSSRYIQRVEQELDKDFLTSSNLEFHYNRMLENFKLYFKDPNFNTKYLEFEKAKNAYVKENYSNTFVNRRLCEPGVLMKVKKENEEKVYEYLVGDVNTRGSFGGGEKRGLHIADNSIVVSYTKVWVPEVVEVVESGESIELEMPDCCKAGGCGRCKKGCGK
jgi:hypothetical protein